MTSRYYDTQQESCVITEYGYSTLQKRIRTMTAKVEKAQATTGTDRIEKRVVLHAPRSRVWRAISSAQEFGSWFRMNLDGAFAEGATIRGRVTAPGYEHVTLDMLVERIDPERYFSYRWHPYAIDPAVDYSTEPTTLVEFTLEDTEGAPPSRLSNPGLIESRSRA